MKYFVIVQEKTMLSFLSYFSLSHSIFSEWVIVRTKPFHAGIEIDKEYSKYIVPVSALKAARVFLEDPMPVSEEFSKWGRITSHIRKVYKQFPYDRKHHSREMAQATSWCLSEVFFWRTQSIDLWNSKKKIESSGYDQWAGLLNNSRAKKGYSKFQVSFH